jgi:predicted house-cleaning noncanonical NTP pyrophosphatase (MazG superfamily)
VTASRKLYGKLVRDLIPEIIASNGDTCEVRTLQEAEMPEALRMKLFEEQDELAKARGREVIVEAADLIEVVEAIAAAEGFSLEDVLRLKATRRAERGAFEKRTFLIAATSVT